VPKVLSELNAPQAHKVPKVISYKLIAEISLNFRHFSSF